MNKNINKYIAVKLWLKTVTDKITQMNLQDC